MWCGYTGQWVLGACWWTSLMCPLFKAPDGVYWYECIHSDGSWHQSKNAELIAILFLDYKGQQIHGDIREMPARGQWRMHVWSMAPWTVIGNDCYVLRLVDMLSEAQWRSACNRRKPFMCQCNITYELWTTRHWPVKVHSCNTGAILQQLTSNKSLNDISALRWGHFPSSLLSLVRQCVTKVIKTKLTRQISTWTWRDTFAVRIFPL